MFEQDRLRRGALEQDLVRHVAQQALIHVLHRAVAGEEAEGTSLGDIEHLTDAIGGARCEIRRARIRHVGRHIEQRLAPVVEV